MRKLQFWSFAYQCIKTAKNLKHSDDHHDVSHSLSCFTSDDYWLDENDEERKYCSILCHTHFINQVTHDLTMDSHLPPHPTFSHAAIASNHLILCFNSLFIHPTRLIFARYFTNQFWTRRCIWVYSVGGKIFPDSYKSTIPMASFFVYFFTRCRPERRHDRTCCRLLVHFLVAFPHATPARCHNTHASYASKCPPHDLLDDLWIQFGWWRSPWWCPYGRPHFFFLAKNLRG